MELIKLKNMLESGKSIWDISKEEKLGYSTVRYWMKKYGLSSKFVSFKEKDPTRRKFSNSELKKEHVNRELWNEKQKRSYSYIMGFFLGDGHMYRHKKNSFCFCLTNQASYINMNNRLIENLKILFPTKNIRIYKKKGSDCNDILFQATCMDELFPHGSDAKHTRKIELKEWQREICINSYPKEFIKGLIESDGSRYAADGKNQIVYQFNNCSTDIHSLLHEACKIEQLYFTQSKNPRKPPQVTKYITSFYSRPSVEKLDSFIGPKN